MTDHPVFNPDSWMDMVAYLIIATPALVAAVATLWGQRRRASDQAINKQSGDAILSEVRNKHSTNLRDDIDVVTRTAKESLSGQADIRRDIAGLREELRNERLDRIEGDRKP